MRLVDVRVLAVALAAVLVHAGSLDGKFLEWDDGLLVFDNRRVVEGGFSDLGDMLTPSGPRPDYGYEYLPVRDLSNRVDRLFWGMIAWGYHLGNVLLFGVAAAAFYGVLLRLLRSAPAALGGALVFAVHPVVTESVACIAHRKDVLMAAFGMCAWLAWTRDRRFLAVGLFVLAVLSKLPAIALPGVFLITDLASGRRFDRGRVLGLVALFAVAAGAAAIATSVAPALGGAEWHGGTPFTNALSVGAAFLESVKLLVVPVGLHVGRPAEVLTRTSPDAASVTGLLLILALLAAGIVALVRQRRRPTTGGLVIVLTTVGLLAFQAPYLQVRPFWVLFAERYLVFAVTAPALVAGYLVLRFRTASTRLAVGAVLVVFAWLSFEREAQWVDTETLFTDAYEKEPRSYIALDKVGRLKLFTNPAEARVLFRRSVEAAEELRPVGQALLEQILVNSRQDLINANLALAPRDPARLVEARREAEIWVRGWPESALAHAFLGLVEHKAGRLDEAERLYLESIRLGEKQKTALPMTLHNLGLIHRDRQGPGSPASMELFERSVEADAGHVASWEELARGYAAHDRWEEAARCLRQGLEANPGHPQLARDLASVLRDRLGRAEEAREVLRGARGVR